jgi:hypothetical protein
MTASPLESARSRALGACDPWRGLAPVELSTGARFGVALARASKRRDRLLGTAEAALVRIALAALRTGGVFPIGAGATGASGNLIPEAG